MIEFPSLPGEITAAGPSGRSLSMLAVAPTSHALTGILASRVGFELSEDEFGNDYFSIFPCEDRGADTVRIPGRFAIVCLDVAGALRAGSPDEFGNRLTMALRQEDLYHQPAILLPNAPLQELEPVLLYPGSKILGFQSREVVRILLDYPPRVSLMKRVAQTLPLSLLNPYVYKAPVGANLFVGRTRQMQTLCSGQASFALIGPRAIGKSSLMHRCYEFLTNIGAIAVRVEFGGAFNEGEFLKRILQEFVWVHGCSPRLLTDRRSSVQILTNLLHDLWKRKGDKPVFIFIDEADELDLRCPNLVLAFRQFHDHGWARFVLLGHKQLRRTINDVKRGPLMNVVKELKLTGIDYAECADLVRQPMSSLHIHLENSDHIVRAILRESGGSPSRIQLLCHHLVEQLSRAESSMRVIREADIESVTRLPDVRKEFADWFRYSTSPLEKWLAAVATRCLPASEDELIRIAQMDIRDAGETVLRGEILDLLVANVFDLRSDGCLDFSCPIMRTIATPFSDFQRELREPALHALRTLRIRPPINE